MSTSAEQFSKHVLKVSCVFIQVYAIDSTIDKAIKNIFLAHYFPWMMNNQRNPKAYLQHFLYINNY